MVEAGAKEVDEETMLEALQIAHEEIRRLCEAQVELAKAAGKPKLEVPETAGRREAPGQDREGRGKDLAEATREEAKLARRDKVAAVRPPPPRRSSATTPTPRRRPPSARRSSRSRSGSSASASRSTRSAPTAAGPRSGRSAARCGCCRACTAPALHPRRDPGADEPRARHHQGGAAHRRPRDRDHQALHPPLQLPALQRGRDRVHARAWAPRHRPRRARRAGPAPDDPGRGRVPLHAAAGSRPSRATAPRRWRRSAARRSPCWTPASGSRARWPASRWASSRRATSTSSFGHPGRRGPPRRHGLQGRRDLGGHHRPPDGHQDHRRHLRDPARRARPGEGRPPVHPRRHGRDDPGPARRAVAGRRASPRSRSTRADRHRHRQGRRDDPRARGRLRRRDLGRGRRHRRSTASRARRPTRPSR